MFKSAGPDTIYSTVLRELTELITQLLDIISENSWMSNEILDNWEKDKYSNHALKNSMGGSGKWKK